MRWARVVPQETSSEHLTPELVGAIHGYLAKSPGRILMVQVEDIVGEIDQPNLPGTVHQHPNWQRKLPVTIDELSGDELSGAPLGRSIVDGIRSQQQRA